MLRAITIYSFFLLTLFLVACSEIDVQETVDGTEENICNSTDTTLVVEKQSENLLLGTKREIVVNAFRSIAIKVLSDQISDDSTECSTEFEIVNRRGLLNSIPFIPATVKLSFRKDLVCLNHDGTSLLDENDKSQNSAFNSYPWVYLESDLAKKGIVEEGTLGVRKFLPMCFDNKGNWKGHLNERGRYISN